MDILGQTSPQLILLFILYGITGVVPLLAALYLLLRRGNAFAPGVTPPVRLRRWAVSFFAGSSLGHVWWYLFYVLSCDLNSAAYVLVVMLDCVLLLTTIAGTLLAMLQDRRRPVWPVMVAMIPFVVLGLLQILFPENNFMSIAIVYILSLYVLFSVYTVFAVRRYDRWLNDNYADLENKKVWLSQVVTLSCMLLFILYVLVADIVLLFFLHIAELLLFGLLLWRVETLPQLDSIMEKTSTALAPDTPDLIPADAPARPSATFSPERTRSLSHLNSCPSQPAAPATIDLELINRLLAEHCVTPQLYLQHDLTLQQLAQAIGTNRYYLSQYFSHQGITYNTYINYLRVNHFIRRYEETVATGQSVGAKQLASESGFRSYSTFSRAFTQRTGQSVTAWMRDAEGIFGQNG